MKKLVIAFAFLLWMAAILTLFFVVQKPDFLNVLAGLQNLLLTICIPLLMVTLSTCLGAYLIPDSAPAERLIFGAALGLGIFGLAGFGLAITGLAKPVILAVILLVLTGYFALTGKLSQVWVDVRQVAQEIRASTAGVPPWIPVSAGIAVGLAFLMSLVPPADDFDALAYHLTVPSWWLRDGGLTLYSWVLYWHPHIGEGLFIWPMALGCDTATHIIHLLWLLLTISLVWYWTHQLWDNSIAWNAILILLTMPSLLWLASLAYTDYPLTFAGLATLYSLWRWQSLQNIRWLIIGSLMAGMAISVKYTGFVVPLVGVFLIIVWGQGFLQRFKKVFYFSAISILLASPWYIRNWVWMKNPVYPFVFGGRFWDSFLAQAFSSAGSGIGLDIKKLLALPLTATLGTQDTSFFDGRIGPFILILSPLALYAFWRARQEQNGKRRAMFAIGLFSLVNITAWTTGVINTASLFQTRYLFYSLIPMTIPFSIGLNFLYRLDTNRLKISMVVRAMMAFVVFINLLNFSLQIVVRNPISVVIGITSRQEYMEKRQPGYAHVLALMQNVSENAKAYFLFEPRSYGINIQVQPDAINANFVHDIWLYGTPEKIVAAWKEQGYTHILLSRTGADFIFRDKSETVTSALALEQVENLLVKMEESPSRDYVLYRIP